MCSQAFALGTASYSSELISTRSLGQGGTGVAGTQNDPIAAYTNPAAMTALPGTQFTVGLSYANASPTFTDDQQQVTGARATSVIVPNFGATTQFLGGKVAAGLAVVTPYGLETHFDGDSPIRYATTDARLRIVDITPSVAYKACDAFSVGVGVDYYNALEGALEKKVDTAQINGDATFAATSNFAVSNAAAKASSDSNSRLNGTGDGWGYHLGVTIKPNEQNQIGIVYHSSVKIGLTGNVQLTNLNGAAATIFGGDSFQSGATAPLFMPQNVQIGYSFTPNEKWNFEADMAWYDWYSARQLGVVYTSPLTANQSTILQNGNPTVFHPRKTVNFGAGANYTYSKALQLRAGAYYQAAALPESAFDPAFVDLPRYALTFGTGWKVTPNLGLDLAYDAVFFHSRHVTATNPTGDAFSRNTGYSGNFASFANILSASLSYRTDMHL
jgi:long-chain fatty acid transport protein